MKKAIWRPERRARDLDEFEWRQPLSMPKFHALLVHIGSFVKQYGYFGKFSEESFEHFQQVSRKNRAQHAGNRSSGAQALDDMHYSLLRSAPNVRKTQDNAELLAHQQSAKKRKRTFEL